MKTKINRVGDVWNCFPVINGSNVMKWDVVQQASHWEQRTKCAPKLSLCPFPQHIISKGILHRLSYLSCRHPKSCTTMVHMQGVAAKYIQSSIVWCKTSLSRRFLPAPALTTHSRCAPAPPFESFQLWWRDADVDDYNGDNNQKLCENNERYAHIHRQNQTELLQKPNQFNFHFINDLIISPETVKCTPFAWHFPKTLTFCSAHM